MLVFFVLLISAYQYLIVGVVKLNQDGPGWEVPFVTSMMLGWLSLISIILLLAIIILALVLRKKFLANHVLGTLLLVQLAFCIMGTIFLYVVNAFEGQFYYPDVLVPSVFYCIYAAVAILPIITLTLLIFQKRTLN